MPNDSKKRRTRNRAATEQLLLEACGKLLLRDGPDGIGVNNVVAEAGVGKDLIYRYFDGLPGLVKAWIANDDNWPTVQELTHVENGQFDSLSMPEQVQAIARNYLHALRQRPAIVRVLVSEIMHPTDITAILENAGDRIGRELYESLRLSGKDISDDVVDVSLLFTIVINYLSMRAVTSPQAFGMDLSDEKSWERIEKILGRLVSRYLAV